MDTHLARLCTVTDNGGSKKSVQLKIARSSCNHLAIDRRPSHRKRRKRPRLYITSCGNFFTAKGTMIYFAQPCFFCTVQCLLVMVPRSIWAALSSIWMLLGKQMLETNDRFCADLQVTWAGLFTARSWQGLGANRTDQTYLPQTAYKLQSRPRLCLAAILLPKPFTFASTCVYKDFYKDMRRFEILEPHLIVLPAKVKSSNIYVIQLPIHPRIGAA